MSPLKSSPLEGNKAAFVRGFMYIYQGAKKEPGVGVKERTGREVGWGGECCGADFPTVYMLISNLTALVLEPFIHWMQIFFFSPSLLLLWSLLFFFPFWRHLTVDGKMQMNVRMESLALWIWVKRMQFAEMLKICFDWIRSSDLQQVSNAVTAYTWREFSFLCF